MARARNIKPGFFTNDSLVELSFEVRLLFIGLWTIADRAGRLLDRPKKIKMELFPADSVEVDEALAQLAEYGFITRYEVDGKRFIQVENWDKHQNPHIKEAKSIIPPPGANTVQEPGEPDAETNQGNVEHSASTIQAPCEHSTDTIRARLIPDSGFRIPDSGFQINQSIDQKISNAHEANESPPDAKPMAEDWEPSDDCVQRITEAGLLSGLADEVAAAAEFRSYWLTRPKDRQTPAGWDHKFFANCRERRRRQDETEAGEFFLAAIGSGVRQ